MKMMTTTMVQVHRRHSAMIHIAPALITRTRGLHDEDHDDGVTMVMIKCLDLEKKKEKSKKNSR